MHYMLLSFLVGEGGGEEFVHLYLCLFGYSKHLVFLFVGFFGSVKKWRR